MREMNKNCESYQAPSSDNKLSLRQIINKIKKIFSGDKVEIKIGFHHASGFITLTDGRVIYVSTEDERWANSADHILFRTAKHTKDFSGGRNSFFNLRYNGKDLEKDEVVRWLF